MFHRMRPLNPWRIERVEEQGRWKPGSDGRPGGGVCCYAIKSLHKRDEFFINFKVLYCNFCNFGILGDRMKDLA